MFARSSYAQSSAEKPTQRTVAITVDDLPGAEPGTDHAIGNLKELEQINRAIPAALTPTTSRHRIRKRMEASGAPRTRRSRRAPPNVARRRNALGNHTYSHPDFQTTPLDRYEDETIAAKS